jgi:hypothetical protein
MSDAAPSPPDKPKASPRHVLTPGPGRPKGCQNKATIEIKQFAHRFVTNKNYLRKLRLRVNDGTAPHMETLLWHYAYGKPKEEEEGKNDKHVTIMIVQHTPSESVKTIVVNEPQQKHA